MTRLTLFSYAESSSTFSVLHILNSHIKTGQQKSSSMYLYLTVPQKKLISTVCPNWDTWEYLREFVMQCLFSKVSERYWVAQQRTRCLLVPECPEVLWSGRGWRTYGRVCYVSLHIKSPPSHNNTLVLPCYNNPVILWCVEWLPHYCTIQNNDFTVMVYVQKMFAGSEIQLEPYI